MAEAVIAEQNEDKRETVKFINKLFEMSKSWKFLYAGQNHSKWVDDIKWVKGLQYPHKLSDDGKIKISFNRLWSFIQKELPFMTDRPPKLYVEPTEPSDKYAAELFQMLLASKWLQRDMDKKIPEGTLNAKEIGTAFYRPFWNQDLENGLGDVDCDVIDPIEAFPFAYTNELTKEKCEGFIWARNVSLGWIRRNYSAEGWRVKATTDPSIIDRAKETAINTSSGDYAQVGDIGTTVGYTSTETDYLPSVGGGDLKGSDLKRVTIIKCYLKDGSQKDYEGEDKEQKGKKEVIYPNGRCITIAGGVVLEDEPFQFNSFPGFVEQRNYIQPSEFWGESDVTQIKEGQKLFNKIFSTLAEAVRRGIYTQKFILESSGIDADNYVTSEDAIYSTRIPNPVSESMPQALPPQAFNMIQLIEQAMASTAGVIEYNPPSGGDLPSGRSLAEMNEITQTRLRQKLRNLEYSVRKIGSAWLEMMLKNYTEDRVMRLINPSTNESEWAYIFREENPQKAEIIKQNVSRETIPGTEQVEPKTGQPIPESGKKKYNHLLNLAEIKGTFDLNVATGSTVSVSKYATYDQAAMLYKLGAIDRQALLEAADFPNRNDIERRMAQAGMQQQQAMQQTQAQEDQKEMGIEQMGNQTTMQKTQMDNQTKVLLEEMKQKGNLMRGVNYAMAK